MFRISRLRGLSAAAVATVMAGAALAGCGSSGGGSDGSFKVGYVSNFSGSGSVYTDASQAGINAAVTDINTKNLAGRTVSLDTADGATDPQTTSQVCNRLVQQDKVNALIVFVTGPQLTACNQIAQRAKIPVLSLSSGAGTICAPNLFSFSLLPNQEVIPVIQTLLDQGKKKWYFFGSDYSTPKATIAVAKAYLTAHGGTVVGESYAATGTTDFSQDIGRITAAKPDVAFLNAVGNDDVTLQKQWAGDPRTQGIVRTDPLLNESLASSLAAAANGIYSAGPYFNSVDTPDNAAFKTAVAAAKPGVKVDINAYLSWVMPHMLANSVKAVGSDPQKITQNLSSATYQAPAGTVTITQGFTQQDTYLVQAGADGSLAVQRKETPVPPQTQCA